MVRSIQYTREDVIRAGFQVVKKDGLDHLSARKVALELGSSTAPVYSNFENMEELEEALFGLAAGKFMEFATERPTDDSFLNMGIGVLRYARECPRWYLAFSTNPKRGRPHLREITRKLLGILAEIPALAGLSLPERKLLLRKMEVFTHGLAFELCTGSVGDEAMEDMIQILQEVGGALTAEALQCHPRLTKDVERLATPSWDPVPATAILANGKDDGHDE